MDNRLYDSWVDKMISSHQQKLKNLKLVKNYYNYNHSFDIIPKRERDIEKNIISPHLGSYSYTSRCFPTLDIDNKFEFDKLKQRRIEKILDSYLEENVILKLKIQEMEENMKKMKYNSRVSLYDPDFKLFGIEEKELLNTIKILECENKKLEIKNTELTNELNLKSKLNGKNVNKNIENDAKDWQLLCLKLDRVIEIMLGFLSKYEPLTKITQIVKDFDYEMLKIKLSDFGNMITNLENNNLKNLHLNNLDHSFSAEKELSNVNQLSSNRLNNNSTSKDTILDNDLITKLDSRLKQLESNFQNIFEINQKSTLGTSTAKKPSLNLTSSKSERTLTDSKSIERKKNPNTKTKIQLESSIKNTKIKDANGGKLNQTQTKFCTSHK